MTARNYEVGVVLTPAALLRVRRIADAAENPDLRDGPDGTEDEELAALGERWVEVACAIYAVTKDLQATQDVIAAALNRVARKVREAARESR